MVGAHLMTTKTNTQLHLAEIVLLKFLNNPMLAIVCQKYSCTWNPCFIKDAYSTTLGVMKVVRCLSSSVDIGTSS